MVRPLVNRFPNAEAVALAAASDLFEFVQSRLNVQNRVDIAVTGGTVGISTLAAARDLPFNDLNLENLHIWWGDERYVDAASDDRNSNQATKAWLRTLNIPAQNIHEFPNSDSGLSVTDAAIAFEGEFIESKIHFDLMLMGMGPDGHIASLFPDKPEPVPGRVVVAEEDSPKPPPQRLTFTYEEINRTQEIWFTVAGSDKALAVSTVFGDSPTSLPAGRVHGKEKTVWYIDQTAGNLVWGC